MAALALALVLGLTRLGGASVTVAGKPRPPRATLITVEPGRRGRRVPFGFLGLSLEYPSIEAYAGTDPPAPDPVFEQLVRNLAPGRARVLRIGGDSTDRTWWPEPGVTQPPGIKFAVTARWLAVTGRSRMPCARA